MSISCEILGAPGGDNAVLLRVDSGQGVERLLFDCGEGCLASVKFAELLAIDHLFFSHLHMDHVGGFDAFFRALYHRETKPNQLWGPPETSRILHHRFQGYLWNLHAEMSARWHVTDIYPDRCDTTSYELTEAFAAAHECGSQPLLPGGLLLDEVNYTVSAITLDHHTPVIGYIVREKTRKNVEIGRLANLGLRPGPWLQTLKATEAEAETLLIDGHVHNLAELREQLLVETPGDSVAYLTDFRLDTATEGRLADFLQGCHTIICEAQYRQSDLALAQQHHHLTTVLTAQLARRVQAQRLVLFHLSSRYQPAEWLEMLAEAKEVFPATEFPASWVIS